MDENEMVSGIRSMKKYLDELEFVANLEDIDLVPSDLKDETQQSCNIFIMRHAERVDFTFGNWIQHCFDDKGNYVQKDLNLPSTLPNRECYPQSYKHDTPITNVGKFQAKSMGKNFKARNIEIDYVYCSPAFRCLQTCDAFLRGFGKENTLKIRVEPALFEWVPWIGEFPQLMSTHELVEAGYNVDTAYKPYLTEKQLKENKESMEAHYGRGHAFIRKIIDTHPSGGCLLVGHASTLDTCSRNLMNGKWLSPKALMDLSSHIHYCSSVQLIKKDNEWSLTTPPCPPMSYGINKQFNWKALLQKY